MKRTNAPHSTQLATYLRRYLVAGLLLLGLPAWAGDRVRTVAYQPAMERRRAR